MAESGSIHPRSPRRRDLLTLARALAGTEVERDVYDTLLPVVAGLLGISPADLPPPASSGSAAHPGASPDDGEITGESVLEAILATALERVRRRESLVRERDDARRQLEQSRRAEIRKDHFLSAVSHEFRTPLTSIRSFAEILLSQSSDDEETTREFLGIIHEESIRLSHLVNNLLDLAKIEAGRMVWEFTESELEDAVGRAVRAIRSLAVEKQVRVVVDGAAEAIPAFYFDRDKVIQVLVNLLSNAVKHSPPGEEVKVRIRSESDRVEIAVCDRGPGIPAEVRGRIFERFFQAGSSERRAGGTGLGLSISREIVLAHGGEIEARESPGGGSELRFTLLFKPSPAVEPQEESRLPPSVESAFAPSVLVVDDDPQFRRFLTTELTAAGFRVHHAENGVEGLRAMRDRPPRAVILDYELPDLSGPDLLTLLRANPSSGEIPVFVVTSAADAIAPERVSRDRVLPRPVDGGRLLRLLREALSSPELPSHLSGNRTP